MIDKKTKEKLKLIYKCRQCADKLIFQIEKDFELEKIELKPDCIDADNNFFCVMQNKSQAGNLTYKEMLNILKSFINMKNAEFLKRKNY